MVLGERVAITIWNEAEIRFLKKGRKSPESTGLKALDCLSRNVRVSSH